MRKHAQDIMKDWEFMQDCHASVKIRGSQCWEDTAMHKAFRENDAFAGSWSIRVCSIISPLLALVSPSADMVMHILARTIRTCVEGKDPTLWARLGKRLLPLFIHVDLMDTNQRIPRYSLILDAVEEIFDLVNSTQYVLESRLETHMPTHDNYERGEWMLHSTQLKETEPKETKTEIDVIDTGIEVEVEVDADTTDADATDSDTDAGTDAETEPVRTAFTKGRHILILHAKVPHTNVPCMGDSDNMRIITFGYKLDVTEEVLHEASLLTQGQCLYFSAPMIDADLPIVKFKLGWRASTSKPHALEFFSASVTMRADDRLMFMRTHIDQASPLFGNTLGTFGHTNFRLHRSWSRAPLFMKPDPDHGLVVCAARHIRKGRLLWREKAHPSMVVPFLPSIADFLQAHALHKIKSEGVGEHVWRNNSFSAGRFYKFPLPVCYGSDREHHVVTLKSDETLGVDMNMHVRMHHNFAISHSRGVLHPHTQQELQVAFTEGPAAMLTVASAREGQNVTESLSIRPRTTPYTADMCGGEEPYFPDVDVELYVFARDDIDEGETLRVLDREDGGRTRMTVIGEQQYLRKVWGADGKGRRVRLPSQLTRPDESFELIRENMDKDFVREGMTNLQKSMRAYTHWDKEPHCKVWDRVRREMKHIWGIKATSALHGLLEMPMHTAKFNLKSRIIAAQQLLNDSDAIDEIGERLRFNIERGQGGEADKIHIKLAHGFSPKGVEDLMVSLESKLCQEMGGRVLKQEGDALPISLPDAMEVGETTVVGTL